MCKSEFLFVVNKCTLQIHTTYSTKYFAISMFYSEKKKKIRFTRLGLTSDVFLYSKRILILINFFGLAVNYDLLYVFRLDIFFFLCEEEKETFHCCGIGTRHAKANYSRSYTQSHKFSRLFYIWCKYMYLHTNV